MPNPVLPFPNGTSVGAARSRETAIQWPVLPRNSMHLPARAISLRAEPG